MNNINKEYSIPHHGLTSEQKEEADKVLRKKRFEKLAAMADDQKIYADLIALKLKIKGFVENTQYSESFLFSDILKHYVSIVKTTRRKLSEDLGIHESKFSRIINNKENPGIGFLYRIEEHSNKILPASLLWQIVSLKLVESIKSDNEERQKQSAKVKNKVIMRI